MLFSAYQSFPPFLNDKDVWTPQQVVQIETLRSDFKKLNDYKDLGKLYTHCLTELCKGAYEKREIVSPNPRLRAISDLDLAFGFPVMALFLALPHIPKKNSDYSKNTKVQMAAIIKLLLGLNEFHPDELEGSTNANISYDPWELVEDCAQDVRNDLDEENVQEFTYVIYNSIKEAADNGCDFEEKMLSDMESPQVYKPVLVGLFYACCAMFRVNHVAQMRQKLSFLKLANEEETDSEKAAELLYTRTICRLSNRLIEEMIRAGNQAVATYVFFFCVSFVKFINNLLSI